VKQHNDETQRAEHFALTITDFDWPSTRVDASSTAPSDADRHVVDHPALDLDVGSVVAPTSTSVDSLPLSNTILQVLSRLGAATVADITTFAPDDLERLHGLGRPGRLLIEQTLVDSGVPWDGARERARPALKAREPGKISLAEAGLTDAALVELAAQQHSTLRHISTWDADTLASVVSVDTFAEAHAALTWYGLSFIDTARAATFVQGVRHIREHYDEHGFVPGAETVYKDFRLGQWVAMTRQQYKAKTLDPSRIHALEALPYWTWTSGYGGGMTSKRVADILEAARAYSAEHGHLDVPSLAQNTSLRRGLESVRQARENLSVAAVAEFEALPNWTWNQAEADARSERRYQEFMAERPPSSQWLSRLEQLRAKAEAAGGLDKAALRGTPDLNRLSAWASTQRSFRESLSSPQRELLEAIPGWTWDAVAARKARNWEEAMARLEAHVAGGNSPDVPAVFRYDGFALGAWVRRQHIHRDDLTAEQSKRLEAISGWSWREYQPRRTRASRATLIRREVRWEAARLLAAAFFAEHHYWPSRGIVTESDLDLGLWIVSQRSQRSQGLLSQRRVAALDATPGWRWNGQTQRGRSGPDLHQICTSLDIKPGVVLLGHGGTHEAEAILDDEYRIEVVSSPGEGVYESPTRAWARVTAGQSPRNGWDAWKIEFDGDVISLRTLRNRVAEMHGGGD
jgi:hypothetical protein